MIEIKLNDGDRLSITVGLEVLRRAFEGLPEFEELDEKSDSFLSYKVTNDSSFITDLISSLEKEDEEGNSLITKMLDTAFVDLVENGSSGVSEDKVIIESFRYGN